MDYKKSDAAESTISRDSNSLCENTGNIYETVKIIGKRANQISVEIKSDLERKLQEFSSNNVDNLEEIFETRDQIEISKYYEQLPKATLLSIQEYLEDKTYYRNPSKMK